MVCWTPEQRNQMLQFCLKQEILFYDIETSALDSSDGHIIGFGISNNFNGYYLPLFVYNAHNNCLEPVVGADEFAKELLKIIATKKVCAFNGAFDLPWTKDKFGIDLLPNYYCDVLLLKHTVDEEFPFKLKEIAVQVFGFGAASEQRDLQTELKALGASKGEIYKANPNTIGKYCIQDCLLTAKLFKHYSAKLAEQGLEQFFYVDEVMPLYKHVTIPMEQYGVAIDVPLMQSTLAEITADIQAIESKIQEAIKPLLGKFHSWFLGKDYPPSRTGNFAQAYAELNELELPRTESGKLSLTAKNLAALPDSHAKQVLLKAELMTDDEVRAVQLHMAAQDHGQAPLFNLQSKHHLKKLFFDTLGLTPLSTTDLGNPQVDDEFIHSIADKYEWAMDLHVYNKLQKIKSTYVERFLEQQRNGIFYPSFFQHRTVSGRFGSDLQQLPRKVSEAEEPHEAVRKYVNRIRDFFVARPEHKLIGADYESLEPHIFAHVSGDKRIQAIFQQGHDFYSSIAIMTENLSQYSADKQASNYLGKLDKPKRQKAKAYSLGIPYGMTGYKLAFELGIEPEDAEQLVENYLTAFPDLKKWMDSSVKHVLDYGYIQSQAGRIRHLGRAKAIAAKYGTEILDSLWLYKEYGNQPALYQEMKKVRRELKNYLNNGMNFQIQSLAASIVNQAAIAIMNEFKHKGLKAQICMNVHDEIVCEAPDAEVEQVCEIMQRNMENIRKLDVKLKAEPQVATVYGATK
jgi:DNA polymerase I-like protein with 3'-5' exonuclease and polymerase domains